MSRRDTNEVKNNKKLDKTVIKKLVGTATILLLLVGSGKLIYNGWREYNQNYNDKTVAELINKNLEIYEANQNNLGLSEDKKFHAKDNLKSMQDILDKSKVNYVLGKDANGKEMLLIVDKETARKLNEYYKNLTPEQRKEIDKVFAEYEISDCGSKTMDKGNINIMQTPKE